MFPTDTKILVIDDMLTMRKLVKKSLNGIGFNNVSEATDGDHAWNEIQTAVKNAAPFSLIISDWNMPKMTGLEFLKNCKGDPKFKSLPFILVTAESEQAQIIEAAKAGVSDYVIKPFNAVTFKEKLQRTYNKHNPQTKAA